MDGPPPSSSSSPPSPRLHLSDTCVLTENPSNPFSVDPNPMVHSSPPAAKRVGNEKKKKKRGYKDASSSSSSCSSSFTRSGTSVAFRRRSMRVVRYRPVRRSEGGGVEAIALPLGMSIAAVVAQVLEKKDAVGNSMSVDHLSRVCSSAVRESLTNVFGDKFDYFARNFEKSFGSTLRTLRLINEASTNKGQWHLNNRHLFASDVNSNEVGCTSPCGVDDHHSETDLPTTETRDLLSANEAVQEQIPRTSFISKGLALDGENNQLVCASTSRLGPVITQNVLTTMEKSVVEQGRSNDLKALELGISMKKLKLKETELALNHESNHLERSKLAMGISKASFKAGKFKYQLEDTRHADLLRKCLDCLVAGIVIMSASISYAAYVYSYRKISEATEACTPSPQEAKSWWIPNRVSSLNAGLNTLKCQVQVMSRMIFGFLMILVIAYLLLQRAVTSRSTMPITFILLLLGLVCGFAGKICVDTLGGSGYLWLLYWETLCLLHFFSNTCTSLLFLILYGPINVTQGVKSKIIVPYWVRRSMFYSSLLLFIPLVCGLVPFASLGEWKQHFSMLLLDYMSTLHD